MMDYSIPGLQSPLVTVSLGYSVYGLQSPEVTVSLGYSLPGLQAENDMTILNHLLVVSR